MLRGTPIVNCCCDRLERAPVAQRMMAPDRALQLIYRVGAANFSACRFVLLLGRLPKCAHGVWGL